MNPDHLRTAIDRIGIEKPSDYTLVMEEVGTMEAEEKLVERVARALMLESAEGKTDEGWPMMESYARAAIEASGLLPLLTAATTFIEECDRMGWGETSEKWLPPSFDNLKAAVKDAQG